MSKTTKYRKIMLTLFPFFKRIILRNVRFFMTPDELRRKIREELPEGIGALANIITDPKTSARAKIDAFKALADRGGIPEIKATITQTIAGPPVMDDLEEQKNALLREQEAIQAEIKEIKAGGVEDAEIRRNAVLPQPVEQEGA
jgi:hypothetical protein